MTVKTLKIIFLLFMSQWAASLTLGEPLKWQTPEGAQEIIQLYKPVVLEGSTFESLILDVATSSSVQPSQIEKINQILQQSHILTFENALNKIGRSGRLSPERFSLVYDFFKSVSGSSNDMKITPDHPVLESDFTVLNTIHRTFQTPIQGGTWKGIATQYRKGNHALDLHRGAELKGPTWKAHLENSAKQLATSILSALPRNEALVLLGWLTGPQIAGEIYENQEFQEVVLKGFFIPVLQAAAAEKSPESISSVRRALMVHVSSRDSMKGIQGPAYHGVHRLDSISGEDIIEFVNTGRYTPSMLSTQSARIWNASLGSISNMIQSSIKADAVSETSSPVTPNAREALKRLTETLEGFSFYQLTEKDFKGVTTSHILSNRPRLIDQVPKLSRKFSLLDRGDLTFVAEIKMEIESVKAILRSMEADTRDKVTLLRSIKAIPEKLETSLEYLITFIGRLEEAIQEFETTHRKQRSAQVASEPKPEAVSIGTPAVDLVPVETIVAPSEFDTTKPYYDKNNLPVLREVMKKTLLRFALLPAQKLEKILSLVDALGSDRQKNLAELKFILKEAGAIDPQVFLSHWLGAEQAELSRSLVETSSARDIWVSGSPKIRVDKPGKIYEGKFVSEFFSELLNDRINFNQVGANQSVSVRSVVSSLPHISRPLVESVLPAVAPTVVIPAPISAQPVQILPAGPSDDEKMLGEAFEMALLGKESMAYVTLTGLLIHSDGTSEQIQSLRSLNTEQRSLFLNFGEIPFDHSVLGKNSVLAKYSEMARTKTIQDIQKNPLAHNELLKKVPDIFAEAFVQIPNEKIRELAKSNPVETLTLMKDFHIQLAIGVQRVKEIPELAKLVRESTGPELAPFRKMLGCGGQMADVYTSSLQQ